MQAQSLCWKDPLEEEMATHSSILAWEIPWTEEPAGLQFMGSQKSQTWLRDWTNAFEMWLELWKFPNFFSFQKYIYFDKWGTPISPDLWLNCHNNEMILAFQFSSVQSLSHVRPLWPHESQHARPPCPSPTLGVHSDSHPSSQWCHPAISSSVVPFSGL